ncbi:GGDEF domain-containing protein [Noviherbaspirillum sp.]|uniref:GGDEF domain-containing protein n=1 Tax=Noviherbaspirillum sp. TaxID=1926288 RepID=UPI002D289494|nr:GGDEF domain-containing protein [Noviherbaspirillum sp.]HZW21015.1 GGDEF domain-containing protein [Noviherbaspirillum sp.]
MPFISTWMNALAACMRSRACRPELTALLDNSPDLIARFDDGLRCTYINSRVQAYFKVPPERVIGKSVAELRPCRSLRKMLMRLLHDGGEATQEYKDGGRSFEAHCVAEPGADGTGSSVLCIVRDVTARRRAQEELKHQATHDPLTGLPNRALLTDRLMQAISYAQRYHRAIAVAFLDLDRFKHINDTLGHDAGDQLLKTVAARLSACVRDSDTVARLGGDEFVLVLYDQANEEITCQALRRVLGSISQPMEICGRELTISCSIGFAVYPQDGRDADTLIKNADTAMYRAKERGRDTFRFYDEDLHARINERLRCPEALPSRVP